MRLIIGWVIASDSPEMRSRIWGEIGPRGMGGLHRWLGFCALAVFVISVASGCSPLVESRASESRPKTHRAVALDSLSGVIPHPQSEARSAKRSVETQATERSLFCERLAQDVRFGQEETRSTASVDTRSVPGSFELFWLDWDSLEIVDSYHAQIDLLLRDPVRIVEGGEACRHRMTDRSVLDARPLGGDWEALGRGLHELAFPRRVRLELQIPTCRLTDDVALLLALKASPRAPREFVLEGLPNPCDGPDQTYVYSVPLVPQLTLSRRTHARAMARGWGAFSNVEEMEMSTRLLGGGDGTTVFHEVTEYRSDLSDLPLNASYEVRLRARRRGSDIWSRWSRPATLHKSPPLGGDLVLCGESLPVFDWSIDAVDFEFPSKVGLFVEEDEELVAWQSRVRAKGCWPEPPYPRRRMRKHSIALRVPGLGICLSRDDRFGVVPGSGFIRLPSMRPLCYEGGAAGWRVSDEVVDAALRAESALLRQELASDWRTPHGVLWTLAIDHPDTWVEFSGWSNLPESILLELAANGDWERRIVLARQAPLSAELQSKLVRDESSAIRTALACVSQERLLPEIVDRLAEDPATRPCAEHRKANDGWYVIPALTSH